MIEITYRSGDGTRRLEVNGHAGYNPGKDIVCAGVSAIEFAVLGWCENHPECVRDAAYAKGHAVAELADDPEAGSVMEAAVIGLLQIAAAYPDYVKFTENSQIS